MELEPWGFLCSHLGISHLQRTLRMWLEVMWSKLALAGVLGYVSQLLPSYAWESRFYVRTGSSSGSFSGLSLRVLSVSFGVIVRTAQSHAYGGGSRLALGSLLGCGMCSGADTAASGHAGFLCQVSLPGHSPCTLTLVCDTHPRMEILHLNISRAPTTKTFVASSFA